MNITRIAIENNRLTFVLLAVVVLAGVQNFLDMPRAYDPGFILRTAQVVTYFPGASPERVEQLVSSQLEDAIKELPELDYVQSQSRTGVSILMVNIKESYTRMRPIWDRLRRKVEDVAVDLPEGVSGPYVNDEFGDVFGIVMTITGEGFSYAELKQVAEEVRDELLRIPDAAKVEIHGKQDERIFIEYDNARLAELGISPYQLSQWLSSRNIVISGGAFNLVYPVIDSVPFRAAPIRQIKAWLAGNGKPFPRAATRSWRIGAAPCGRARKGPSAALCLLERTGPFPARHALRLAPS